MRGPYKMAENVADIAGSQNYALTLFKNGTVSMWSIWSMTNANSNIEIPSECSSNIKAIAVANERCIVIKNNGELFEWGLHPIVTAFQLNHITGDVTSGTIDYNTKLPQPVQRFDNCIAASGYLSSGVNLTIKSDGSVWAWGKDYIGVDSEFITMDTPPEKDPYLTPVMVFTPEGLPVAYLDKVTDATEQSPKPPPASELKASPTASTVYINGEAKAFEAYNIDGNNYFKLRDLAFVLNGTEKQFEVGYDNDTRVIALTSGKAYTLTGNQEMIPGDGKAKTATPTASKIYFDDEELNLTVYTIGGNNFFRLRDLMQAIDVYVGYDNATRAITLDTSMGYVPE